MQLLALYDSFDSSFISNPFFVLSLDSWFDKLFSSKSAIFLFHYYTNLNSWIICCLSSGDIYLFFGTSFGLALAVFDSLFYAFLKTLVISSAILLPIKSPVASAAFWISLIQAVFIASVVNFSAVSRRFWLHLFINYIKCVAMFLAKDRNLYSFAYIFSLGSIEYLIFICP